MHWQFGGNLEPVQIICESNWKQCPKAIANYIWSEIVTDVLDCLKNEGIIWRVLAVFCICIILLRTICSKTRGLNDAAANKEILNKVGYKVEDLELKVNVLTYKMQYGSWPLPHHMRNAHFRKHLGNIRLTLSNPNDRNEWIKHILLSPRRNESYLSYSRCNFPSKHHLTALFDSRKKNMYPYFRPSIFSIEDSSKSSKSSSKESLKLNSVYGKKTCRRQRKISKSENFNIQQRNTISSPLFSKKRNSKSTTKISRNSKLFKVNNVNGSYKKFTKTMDECKQYLRELHKSNKNLGFINSASDISDKIPTGSHWSNDQKQKNGQQKGLTVSCEQFKVGSGKIKEDNTEREVDLNDTRIKQQNKDNNLNLSNTVHPVLKLVDENVLPRTMNITFCTEVFPQQSTVTNLLIPQAQCEHQKLIQTSQETLTEVKKKLESLHNVMRRYEIQNSKARLMENNNKTNNICQNIEGALVSVTSDVNKWNEKKRNRINFHNDITNSNEMEQTFCNSPDRYESDEAERSSETSNQNYSSIYTIHSANNINNIHYSLSEKLQSSIYSSNKQSPDTINNNEATHSTTIKNNKIPERVYYSISAESFEGGDIKKISNITENFATLPNVYIDNNQMKAIAFPGQCPVAMETDEDVIIQSPCSSHTEMSKDSEYDEQSTALLLHEAVQFKKALLTHVELEKVCCIDDNKENINDLTSEHGRHSYIKNNLQSKFLDIISEEQSISTSTEKTSRTYMFFNIKPDKGLEYLPIVNNNIAEWTQNEIKDLNACKGNFDSSYNLGSSSEYFSFSNLIQDGNGVNNNQLYLSKHNFLQSNECKEMIPSNSQLKYLNNNLDKSDKKIVELQITNCLHNPNRNINEQGIHYDHVQERNNFGNQLLYIDDINEFMNKDSIELFSENLNETILDEENLHRNESSNYFKSQSVQHYANMTCDEDTEYNLLDAEVNIPNDDTYTEDNETLTFSSNFTLKRHPGICSLVEPTNIERIAEMLKVIKNTDTIYNLSTSESKDNSIETFLMQDSFSSSINHSNDSNIPEPPSVMVLTNKSTDEEDLNLNWSEFKDNSSNDYVNRQYMHSLSKNTVILQNNVTVEAENYSREKPICNENITSAIECTATEVHKNKNDHIKDEKNNLITRNSFAQVDKKDSINEADFRKSNSNHISAHSSLYFTDEASSSVARMNNAYSKNVENCLHLNLYTTTDKEKILTNKSQVLEDTENNQLTTTFIPNERKNSTKLSYINTLDNSISKQQTLSDLKPDNNKDKSFIKSYPKSMDASLVNEVKQMSELENNTIDNNIAIAYMDTNNRKLLSPRNIHSTKDKALTDYLKITQKELNVQHNTFVPNSSSRQISLRDIQESMAVKKGSSTFKSKNEEDYSSKLEYQQKIEDQENIKSLKFDLSNIENIQGKIENNTNSLRLKGNDLFAESRRNLKHDNKLVKKMTGSQISFQTNEPLKQSTSQSHVSPDTSNAISQRLSLETKLQLRTPKFLLSTLKTSSKSCIPILKSRLDAARRTEKEMRPKSPQRGPLTMTMFWRDNLNSNNHDAAEDMQVEGKSENNGPYIDETCSYSNKQPDNQNPTVKKVSIKKSEILKDFIENPTANIIPEEQTVIYVNMFNKFDHNITKIVNPNKLLEYIKTRELNVQRRFEGSDCKGNEQIPDSLVNKESNGMHKIVTVVSSVINENELNNRNTSSELPEQKKNESFANNITNDNLRNMFFLSVERRDVDVTAKPSVIDTSTSISDLENLQHSTEDALQFRIHGTPQELDNEEYIALLEILHQQSNIVHLQELQNVCKKLRTEYQKSN